MLFRDVLRLLQSGLVCMFLLEGECGDVAGDVSPDSVTGVPLSAKYTREVMVMLGGGGYGLAEEKRQGGRRTVTGSMDPPPQLERQCQGPQGGARDPGSIDGNGDVRCDGVGGRRYPVRHPVAAAW